MALNFQTSWENYDGADIPGQPNDSWSFKFRPVIPFTFVDHPNILRLSIPYPFEGRGEDGFLPISLFDLVVFNETWGRWGIGPVMTFDTTGGLPDEFSIGPDIGGVWQVNKKLNLGLFTQNVFWSDTAVTKIQPVIAYQLGYSWSLSAGDLQIPAAFTATESFDVGSPVSMHYFEKRPYEFDGTIDTVNVELTK